MELYGLLFSSSHIGRRVTLSSVHRDPRFPKGVWYCSFTTAQGRRVMRSTGKKSKAEAKIVCEAWAEAERAAAGGTLSQARATEIINETLQRCGQQPVTRCRLGEWLIEWLEAKKNVSAQLLKRYRFACSKFLEFLGTGSERRFLDSVNSADISRFAAELSSEGRCGATVNRIVRVDLGGAFNRAVKLGKIGFSPIAGVEPEKDDDRISERKTFTPEQIVKLIGTSRGTDWEGAILFGYTTGARLQDVSNLRWDGVDLVTGVVVFRQRKFSRRKPDAKTIVAIHPDFESWLLRTEMPDEPKGYVFENLAGRPGGGKRGLTNEFNRLVERAGIDAGRIREKHGKHGRSRRNLSFHSLRHTAASNVFNAAAVKEVARRLTDHAQRGSLDRYLHVNLEAIKNATALIPRLPL
jgi:integrase